MVFLKELFEKVDFKINCRTKKLAKLPSRQIVKNGPSFACTLHGKALWPGMSILSKMWAEMMSEVQIFAS